MYPQTLALRGMAPLRLLPVRLTGKAHKSIHNAAACIVSQHHIPPCYVILSDLAHMARSLLPRLSIK
jgi:hypothetical protein